MMTKLTLLNPATNEYAVITEYSQDIDLYIDWAEQEGWIIVSMEEF